MMDKENSKIAVFVGFSILGAVWAVFLVLYFLDYLAVIIAAIGLIMLVILLAIPTVVILVLIFMAPYYMLKNRPEIQENVSYKLEEIKE